MPDRIRALRLHLSLLVVLALAAAPPLGPAGAQEPPERIAWVRLATGSVEVRPTGNPVKPFEPLARIGQSLFNGDTLRTGPDGNAVVQFADGSRLYCFEDSELTISEAEAAVRVLGFEVEGYPRRLIDVARGAIGLAVEPNEERSTEVESPTAVVGVRGTVIDPFRYDVATGETLVGLKRGSAWGYTPDRQAAFELTPGLLARAGRDALGRATLRSEKGLLGLVTRDHKIELQRGQGVFLDLKTAQGRAVVGALPGSVGRVVVEAGENRALLEARQSIRALVDREAGKVSLESLQGEVSLTDRLGRKSLLVPGRPSELRFRPPAFEPRVIPGPKPRGVPPKGGPSGLLPGAKGGRPGPPAKGTPGSLGPPGGRRGPVRPGAKSPPGASSGLKLPGEAPSGPPKAPSFRLPAATRGALERPSSALPGWPEEPKASAKEAPSPLRRIIRKVIPPLSSPAPSDEPSEKEAPKAPSSEAPAHRPAQKDSPKEKEPFKRPALSPRKTPLLRNPLEMLRR